MRKQSVQGILLGCVVLIAAISFYSCDFLFGPEKKAKYQAGLDETPEASTLGSASRRIDTLINASESFYIPVTVIIAKPPLPDPVLVEKGGQYGFALKLMDENEVPISIVELPGSAYQVVVPGSTHANQSGFTLLDPVYTMKPFSVGRMDLGLHTSLDVTSGFVFIPLGHPGMEIALENIYAFQIPQGHILELRYYRHRTLDTNPSFSGSELSQSVLVTSPATPDEGFDPFDHNGNPSFTILGDLQSHLSLHEGVPDDGPALTPPIHAFYPQRFRVSRLIETAVMIQADGKPMVLVDGSFSYSGGSLDMLLYLKPTGKRLGILMSKSIRPTNYDKDTGIIRGTWFELGGGAKMDINPEGIVTIDDANQSSLLVARATGGFKTLLRTQDDYWFPDTRQTIGGELGRLEYLADQDLILYYTDFTETVRGRYARGIAKATTVTGTLVDLLGGVQEDASRRVSKVMFRSGGEALSKGFGNLGSFGISLVVSSLTKGGYTGVVSIDESTGSLRISDVPVNDRIELTPVLEDEAGTRVSYAPITVTVKQDADDIGSVFLADTGYLFKTSVEVPRYMFSGEDYSISLMIENQGIQVAPPAVAVLSSETLLLDGSSVLEKIVPTIEAKGKNSFTIPISIPSHQSERVDHRIRILIPDSAVGEWEDSVSLRSYPQAYYLAIKALGSTGQTPYAPYVLIDAEGGVSILNHNYSTAYGENISLPSDMSGYYLAFTGAAATSEYSYDIGWFALPYTYPFGSLPTTGRLINEDSGTSRDDSFSKARILMLNADPLRAYLQSAEFDFYRIGF